MSDPWGLAEFVGQDTFKRGLDYFRRGQASRIEHALDGGVIGQVRGSRGVRYSTSVDYMLGEDGHLELFEGSCTCPVYDDCKHSVAVLLTLFEQIGMARPGAPTGPGPARWEESLARLVDVDAEQSQSAQPLGLAFELIEPTGPSTAGRYRTNGQAGRLGLRPVRLGKRGNWIRTGISWAALSNPFDTRDFRVDHVRLLRAIAAGDPSEHPWQRGPGNPWIQLSSLGNPAIWDLLTEAAEADLPLLMADPGQAQVRLVTAGATFDLEVDRTPAGDLSVAPMLRLDGAPCAVTNTLLLGDPVHGIAVWPPNAARSTVGLTLARLNHRSDPDLAAIFKAGPIVIPATDEHRFVQGYLPALRQRHRLVTLDDTIKVPERKPPILLVEVEPLPDHGMRVTLGWEYRQGESSRRVPLLATPMDRHSRDTSEESRVLKLVVEAATGLDQLVDQTSFGPRLRPMATTKAGDTIDLVTRVLPALRELTEVDVRMVGSVPDYREAAELPVVGLSSQAAPGSTDWFDLAVTVTVDGRPVPFDQLFFALATGQDTMILQDGTYFSLALTELAQLRALIEEAKSLGDKPGQLRISRFQVGLWEELEAIGVPDAQSRSWVEQVRSWRTIDDGPDDLPAGLSATLRSYQVDGYSWLNLLRRNGLGGILADDMGLGKTIQTLAMIAQARAEDPSAGPYLVIAPTSVLSNWQSEAARFVPGLRTAVISATAARRGNTLAEACAGADIVITSYTLLRLEIDDYDAIGFVGLILDEAQAVKNHQSKAFACVKRMAVPFKLAITGTPMENNLMELWSLFSIVAPGLFPHPGRFTDYYRVPIEKGGDDDRLGQLRRRIRPLMLRRTKEQVVGDLPAKQEQVLEVELAPAHRRVYQRYLQRERQKVMGLLADMDGNRFAIFRSLTLLRQASIDPALVDPALDDVESTKMTVLLELLEDVIAGGHRALIFSQFTGFLHRVRDRLNAEGVPYSYLDGGTRNRPKVLEEFKNGSNPVFLISLKAGGVGLNLTEADYCILLDPWWNPATEAQAVDRTHRIGQQKNVMVYRIVAKDTIEEKVMALKDAKAKLFAGVMSEDGAGGKSISAQDIRALLA